MPITKKKDGWYWGKKGPYPTKKKAEEVARAVHWKRTLEGKKKTGNMPVKKPYRGKFIRDGKIIRKDEDPTEKSKQWLIDTVERSYSQITNLQIKGGNLHQRGGSDHQVTFNCHDAEWSVTRGYIAWAFPITGYYEVCVVRDKTGNRVPIYDDLLSRIDLVAGLYFNQIPVLEFAWELSKLDLEYNKLTGLGMSGRYFTPMLSQENDDYFWYYSMELRRAVRALEFFKERGIEPTEKLKATVELATKVKALYERIFKEDFKL